MVTSGGRTTIYLVRHARALRREKAAAEGVPDFDRPLRKSGRRQAAVLAEHFAGQPLGRVVSSPVLRCVLTAEPIARSCGLEVEVDQRLSDVEGSFSEMGSQLAQFCSEQAAQNARGAVVAVSHGDTIPAYLERLARSLPNLSAQVPCQTGSAWQLEFDKGALQGATYLSFR